MSSLFLLKLFLAPLLVALLSYLQPRWGDGIGGRLIGLPITTGPFIFIIYIQNGSSFAAKAAHGVVVGQIALVFFCWVYAVSALKMSWARALAVGTGAALVAGAILTSFDIHLFIVLPLLILSWLMAMKYWPAYLAQPRTSEVPRWELPARILVTMILILTLTGAASILGPRVAGALSTYPVIISVLGAFNHHRHGPDSTVATLHGLMKSLPISGAIMTTLAVVL